MKWLFAGDVSKILQGETTKYTYRTLKGSYEMCGEKHSRYNHDHLFSNHAWDQCQLSDRFECHAMQKHD